MAASITDYARRACVLLRHAPPSPLGLKTSRGCVPKPRGSHASHHNPSGTCERPTRGWSHVHAASHANECAGVVARALNVQYN
eukprot:457797-Prymnesium_polylepis.1